VEARLRELLDIPVFHDDQHGTAIVVLAALYNALKVVGKEISSIKVTMAGAGAAGSAIAQLLLQAGVRDIVAADRKGVLHREREDLHGAGGWFVENTNPRGVVGTLRDALAGADVFVGVSGPNILTGDDIATMADDSVVFALANPDPEVDPVDAADHATVVATGRSDYPNQINNVLAFPGVFRGLLDAHSKSVTSEMLLAAAKALSGTVSDDELNATYIVPSVFHPGVTDSVAAAVKKSVEEIRAAGG
jgi:malate dehydrogenase (oxaloacetate-decarboxylating)